MVSFHNDYCNTLKLIYKKQHIAYFVHIFVYHMLRIPWFYICILLYITYFSVNYNIFSKVARIALIKSSLFTVVTFSKVVISARSFVIVPPSIVSIVAFSSLSANDTNSSIPSNLPRFLRAPDHAKIVATEFVEVSSPFKCL